MGHPIGPTEEAHSESTFVLFGRRVPRAVRFPPLRGWSVLKQVARVSFLAMLLVGLIAPPSEPGGHGGGGGGHGGGAWGHGGGHHHGGHHHHGAVVVGVGVGAWGWGWPRWGWP